ncbi:MAG: hypothetical protein ABFS12_05410 [Bacteroidota bacterium]
MKQLITFLITILILSCTSSIEENNNNEVKRFFSEKSFWNQPIPTNAEVDPRSEEWMKMLEQEPTGEYFGVSWRQWTIPVYEVDENTPTYHVEYHYLSEREKKIWNTVVDRERFGHGPNFNPVPIPDGALPDPENDAHFTIVDWKRKLAWDMWGLRKKDDGSWESNTGMCFRLDGDGIFNEFELGYVDGESVHFHGPSRAAGVPAFAGLIMYDEVMSGEIKHKLSCATRYAAYREFVYPASWTDGFTNGGVPEGAVIRLSPDLDLSQFELTKEEIVIAKALQKYGMVIVDIAQGQPIYAEGLWGHKNKSWEGKVRDWDGGINTIPYKHYQVMKVENVIKKGDTRPRHFEE